MNIFVMAKKAIAKALGIEPPKQLPPWWYVDEGSSQLLRPSELAEILDGNDIVAKARLWETIETRDAVVHSCLQTRKLAVSGKPWEIVPASEKRKDRKIAQFVREVFENIEDFECDIADLLDAVGKGFSVLRVNWESEDGRWIPTDLEWIPQSVFGWHWEDGSFGFYDENGDFHRIEDYPGWFLVHNYRGRSAHPSRQGVLHVVAWMFLFKRYALRNWTIANELIGVPMRVGTYTQGATDADITLLKNALKRLGVDAWAVFPEGTNIQFIEPKSRGDISAMFKSLIELANAEIAKAILGQTATLEGTPGKLGREKAREEVRQDLIAADARSVMRTVQKLVDRIVMVNFGQDTPAPKFVIRYEPPDDMTEKAKVLVMLSKVGMGFPENWLRKTFGIPEPQEDEEIIKPMPKLPMKDTQAFSALRSGAMVAHRAHNPDDVGSTPTSASERMMILKELNPNVDEFVLRDYLFNEDLVRISDKAYKAFDYLKQWLQKLSVNSLAELYDKVKNGKLDWKFIKPFGEALQEAMTAAGSRAYKTVFEKYHKRKELFSMQEHTGEFAPPEDAVQWWKVAAFTVAGVENQQALDRISAKIQSAIDDGDTLYDFREQIDELFEDFGYSRANPYHVETVFRTNIATAYSTGQWIADQKLGDALWGWEYVAVMDERTREEHAALNGTRAPKNNPIWNEITPPNGFNCRCYLDEIFDFEAHRQSVAMPEEMPPIDFPGNPATARVDFEKWASEKADLGEIRKILEEHGIS